MNLFAIISTRLSSQFKISSKLDKYGRLEFIYRSF